MSEKQFTIGDPVWVYLDRIKPSQAVIVEKWFDKIGIYKCRTINGERDWFGNSQLLHHNIFHRPGGEADLIRALTLDAEYLLDAAIDLEKQLTKEKV